MKKLVLAALMLCMLLGMPARQVFSAEKYESGHISAVFVDPAGNLVFTLKENVQLCNSGDGREWITVNKDYASAEGIKNLLSTVLSAKLAGSIVDVRGYSGPDGGWGCRLESLGVGD